MNLGEKIKELRLAKDMTLEEVGKIVGVSKSTVRKWETGDIKNMRRDKIAKVAEALDVSPAYLMGWSEAEPPAQEQPEEAPTSNPSAWKRLSGGVARFSAAELDQLLGAAIAIKPSAFKDKEEDK